MIMLQWKMSHNEWKCNRNKQKNAQKLFTGVEVLNKLGIIKKIGFLSMDKVIFNTCFSHDFAAHDCGGEKKMFLLCLTGEVWNLKASLNAQQGGGTRMKSNKISRLQIPEVASLIYPNKQVYLKDKSTFYGIRLPKILTAAPNVD